MLAKRCFDVFFTLPGLIVLAPVMVLIGIWIKIDSKGTVFFRQERMGRNSKIFHIFKFRTMCEDAPQQGAQITVGNDNRITRSGQFLRKYKLDELPQLFNVVIGEMSLVGPRPEVAKYINEYTEEEKAIVLSVLPGITDNASIAYRDESRVLAEAKDAEKSYIKEILPIKIGYYKNYVQTRSLWMDFMIIIRTFYAILR